MNMEKYIEDACLDLIVRKHVYNCSRIFKAADHILYGTVYICGCENKCIVMYCGGSCIVVEIYLFVICVVYVSR
jgi:hypothetical protein